jgi:hypothetical protein
MKSRSIKLGHQSARSWRRSLRRLILRALGRFAGAQRIGMPSANTAAPHPQQQPCAGDDVDDEIPVLRPRPSPFTSSPAALGVASKRTDAPLAQAEEPGERGGAPGA